MFLCVLDSETHQYRPYQPELDSDKDYFIVVEGKYDDAEPILVTSGIASDLILKYTLSSAKKWKNYQMTLEKASEKMKQISRIQRGSLD